MDDMEDAEEDDVGASSKSDSSGRKVAKLQRRITSVSPVYCVGMAGSSRLIRWQISSERDRLRDQRDTFTNQFEELSKQRSTEVESLFERFKEKSGIHAKGQCSIPSITYGTKTTTMLMVECSTK